MDFRISTAGEECFKALSHSLNVRVAKEVILNYKEINTNFPWGHSSTHLSLNGKGKRQWLKQPLQII